MVEIIIGTLSRRRFETYLNAAGHNLERALSLYIWNARVGAAFHIPIQASEVALRNRINHALMAEFGQDWWKNKSFLKIIDHERMRDLDLVITRISRRRLCLDTDQVVAGLSFGFWVGLLSPRYNPSIWGRHLRRAFPALPPDENRESLRRLVGHIANLRNRISHHEPLVKADLSGAYGDLFRLLGWVCPETAEWIRPYCDVPKLVREKP